MHACIMVCARVLDPLALIQTYTAILPCFGMHSQVLDDDILNPGHTVAKRYRCLLLPSCLPNCA